MLIQESFGVISLFFPELSILPCCHVCSCGRVFNNNCAGSVQPCSHIVIFSSKAPLHFRSKGYVLLKIPKQPPNYHKFWVCLPSVQSRFSRIAEAFFASGWLTIIVFLCGVWLQKWSTQGFTELFHLLSYSHRMHQLMRSCFHKR